MKTVWTMQELNAYTDEPLKISGQVDIKEELMQRSQQVLDAQPLSVDGFLSVNPGEYLVYMNLDIGLVMPSSRSLEPVDLHLNLSVTELYLPQHRAGDLDQYEDATAFVLEEDRIDLKEILVDNVLVALPLQIWTDEEKNNDELPQGEDWQVVHEADMEEIHREFASGEGSPFSKLKDLFPDENTD